jgi:hypothetical protein
MSRRIGHRIKVVVAALTLVAGGVFATEVTDAQAAGAIPASGYRLLGGDGGVFAFGAGYAGSAASDPTKCPPNTTDREMPHGTCWALAATPDGSGYWILNASTGAIYDFGTAGNYGSPATANTSVPREFVPNYIGIAPTPDGHGYWVLAMGLSGLGSVSAFGSAVKYGDETTAGVAHSGQPVAIVPTVSGRGYWIVDSDGGVFSYGDAVFHGSAGALHLSAPIVGASRTIGGGGYWLVGADGGIFNYGDATFGGSMAGTALTAPIVGMATNPFGRGYWLAASDGGVFALGGAPFLGSMGASHLDQPVFAIAARAPAPV